MLIVYATDAPLYHRPFATVGLIVTNLAIYIGAALATHSLYVADSEVPWIQMAMLDYSTINPMQWLTSNFMHADITHVIFNMLFLWPFGLLIEGKLGAWRFLLLYLAIGITQCAFEQTIMFLAVGHSGSLGASAVIFGLMAICAIWAPRNDFQVAWAYWNFGSTFELPVLSLCGLYLIIEIFYLALDFAVGQVSSATLHMSGALIGAMAGFALLLTGRVDCEGWDLISVTFDRKLPKLVSAKEQAKLKEQAEAAVENQRQAEQTAREAIARYLDEGHVDVAINRLKLARRESPQFDLGAALHYRLIRELDRAGQFAEAVPLIKTYLTRYTQHVVPLRIKLAHFYITKLSRPTQGMHILATLEQQRLDPKAQTLVHQLKRQAQNLLDEGIIEVYEEET